MGLRFIVGRAGSGKTTTCLQEIQAELAADNISGPPLILLVPEQASFQMEKTLTTKTNIKGVTRAQVMSFRRLGWLVFQEAGGTNRRYLDELGKRMVLRSILIKQGANLRVFQGLAGEQGFIDKLSGSFKEFKNYLITSQKLQEEYQRLVQEGKEVEIVARKIYDLALLFGEFEKYTRDYQTDPDDYLTLLADRIKQAPSLKGARIWIDSFAGFNLQELRVIESLLHHTQEVNLTLCLDPEDLNRQLSELDLFHPTWFTYQQIKELAYSRGIPFELTKVVGNGEGCSRFQNIHLGYLEKNFDRHLPLEGEPRAIELVKSENRRVEVEGIARKIKQLSREKGYRYREMALILRDFTGYQQLVETIFQEEGLPFFMDLKRSVAHHPLVELLIASLETINTYWSYEPLFRYLKTDLIRVSRQDIDLLENFVLNYGIHGSAWLKNEPWTIGLESQDHENRAHYVRINQIRIRSTAALKELQAFIGSNKLHTVKEITSHLYHLLISLKVHRRLDAWYRREEMGGRLERAREHKQIWDGVMELFDQLVNALGEEEMTVAEYSKILEAGLHGLKLGLIPPALDQVLVGTVDRSRQPELKAVFLAGLNEGLFPARVKEDEIFSDGERENLHDKNLRLAPTSKLKTFHEQYLAYIAFTRASEYLWISYAGADDNGKELMPSYLIRKVKELMPGLSEKILTVEPGLGHFAPLSYLSGPQKAIGYLAEKLAERGNSAELEPFWSNLCYWLLSQKEINLLESYPIQALNYHNSSEPLAAKLVNALYGEKIKGSVSRLETFAACPFKFFVQYGLGLRKRAIYQVDAPLKGNYYHLALKELVIRMNELGRSWDQFEEKELLELTKKISAEILPTVGHGIFMQSPGLLYWAKVMEKNLETAVKVLTTHARAGAFRPVAAELGFPPDDNFSAGELVLHHDKKLQLRGQIDRVDLAKINGKTYLRVIDYKSSQRGLDLLQVYYGLTLQLPLYLKMALEIFSAKEPVAAGMLYFPVMSPFIPAKNPVTAVKAEEELYKKMKMTGRILADPQVAEGMGVKEGLPSLIDVKLTKNKEFYKNAKVLEAGEFEVLENYVWSKIAEQGQSIYAGETSINPYRLGDSSPCGFCDYRASCQFDSLVFGNQYNYLPKLPRDRLWELMKADISNQ
ncbi:MAG: helicase-exonuclease AddAB subunit AddB [Bacillota bacterium]